MSSTLNLLTDNQPLTSVTINDNVNCQQANIQQQQGVGVISGMTLSLGTFPAVNVVAGWVQNPRTVQYSGGTFNMPTTAGTWYIMANWTNAVSPSTGMTVYTFSFSAQTSPTPPTGQVCLGCIVQTATAFTSLSTAGLTMLARQSGSQFIVGQNRLISDDSTGIVQIPTLQVGSIGGNGVPFTKQIASITYAAADVTLTSAQYQCPNVFCGGSNSAQQKLVLPLVAGAEWFVANTTGQTIQCIGASGTGIIIPTGNGAAIYSDGTNILRKSPNASLTS